MRDVEHFGWRRRVTEAVLVASMASAATAAVLAEPNRRDAVSPDASRAEKPFKVPFVPGPCRQFNFKLKVEQGKTFRDSNGDPSFYIKNLGSMSPDYEKPSQTTQNTVSLTHYTPSGEPTWYTHNYKTTNSKYSDGMSSHLKVTKLSKGTVETSGWVCEDIQPVPNKPQPKTDLVPA